LQDNNNFLIGFKLYALRYAGPRYGGSPYRILSHAHLCIKKNIQRRSVVASLILIFILYFPLNWIWYARIGEFVLSPGAEILFPHIKTSGFHPATGNPYGHPPWLSECKEIFVNLGANRGTVTRKFFEPSLYPKAINSSISLFDRIFGKDRMFRKSAKICVMGVEPNPVHYLRLSKLQEGYNKRGWRTKFYPFFLSDSEGLVQMIHEPRRFRKNRSDVGAGNSQLVKQEKNHLEKETTQVRSVNIVDFLVSLVGGSTLVSQNYPI